MTQLSLPAYFMRGGTSKALMLLASDLPAEQTQWGAIFMAAMGTPDPYGRQLNGMGGGVSSLSKVCIISPSRQPGIDIDYTFAQVAVKERRVDYRGNCGNMSSAVGPFAVHKGLVDAHDGQTTVRILNTNTNKVIESTFETRAGIPVYAGDLTIPGVSGTGSPIELRFVDPGGASTGKLLPTGAVTDKLEVEGFGPLTVSMVDAANAAVFVCARDIGLKGTELPDELEADKRVLGLLENIRRAASVAMGISQSLEEAADIRIVPFVCIISPAQDNPTLQGELIPANEIDLTARVISNGQPHRALPLTISLCISVASKIEGTIAHQQIKKSQKTTASETIHLGNPSGVLAVRAEVSRASDRSWQARYGAFYRTARLLFDGQVWIPEATVRASDL